MMLAVGHCCVPPCVVVARCTLCVVVVVCWLLYNVAVYGMLIVGRCLLFVAAVSGGVLLLLFPSAAGVGAVAVCCWW